MRSVLRLSAIAFTLTGWILLAVFIIYEYLPSGIASVAPGVLSVTWGAVLAYVFGVRTYFRKREHELIRDRYLDAGIDRLRAFVEEANRVLRSNVSKASDILSRITDGNWPPSGPEYETLDLDPSVHMAMFRATQLLGTDILSSWIITMSSDVGSFSSFLARRLSDPSSPFVEKLRSPENAGAIPALQKFHAECQGHFSKAVTSLLQGLEYISTVVDKDTSLAWANIDGFKNRPEIRGAVQVLVERLREHEEQDVVKRWGEELTILQEIRRNSMPSSQ